MRTASHRVVLCGLALAFAAAGCERSQVAAEADIAISGRLLAQGGGPVSSAPVVVLTEPTGSDLLFGLPFGIGSLGLLCVVDDPPPPCDTRRRVTTSEDGAFRVDMKGRDTQGFLGEAADLLVSAAGPREDDEIAGAALTGTFKVQTEDLALGDLRLWETSLVIGSEGGRGTVGWNPIPVHGYGTPSGYELVFEQGAQRPIWRTKVAGSGAAVDGRVLEDSSGGVALHAKATATTQATTLQVVYRSPLVGYRANAGAPASRGGGCALVTESGATIQASPCGLTDGDLVEEWRPETACGRDDDRCTEPVGNVVVDVGSQLPAKLVVVRGCRESCAVEVSADGTSYRPVGTIVDTFGALAPDPGPPARYVRVSTSGGADGLTEVSMWDRDAPTGPPPVLERLTAAEARQAGRIGTGTAASGPSRELLLVLAVVLVVVAAGASGAASSRLRPRAS